jgi:hypothetical protein
MTLIRQTVRIKSGWVSKVVATNPPKYVNHEEWTWRAALSSDEPFFVVSLFCYDHVIALGKSWYYKDARPNMSITLYFTPHNWNTSKSVHVSFSSRTLTVEDERLKLNPREKVIIHVSDDEPLFMGTLIHVATINTTRQAVAKILLISQRDAQATHGRWRLKDMLTGDLSLYGDFLRQGKPSGIIKGQG